MIPAYVRAAQNGDESAWAELSERHYKSVVSLAYRVVGAEHADDVAQAVFTKLVRTLSQFRGESSFATWLYVVTRSVALGSLRRSRSIAADESLDEMLEGEFAGSVRPGRQTLRAQRWLGREDGRVGGVAVRRELVEALARLAPKQRRLLLLHDVWGYQLPELAARERLTLASVKTHVYRGRQKMRESLGGGK